MLPTLADTRAVLEAAPRSSRVACMVSGGKDSLCTLDVCVRHFGADRVVGVLMYLVKDLEVEWQHARKLEKRYGIKIHGVPHWTLSHFLKENAYRPYVVGAENIKALRQPDVEAFIRKEHDIDWLAWGNRAADSVVRNAYLKRIRGVDHKFRRLYPLWTWKKPDVYGYLKGRKLPIPAITGGRVQMGGVSLTAECLSWLRDNHPGDLRKILDVFPFAEALLFRQEHLHREQKGSRQEQARGRVREGAKPGGRRRPAHAVPEVPAPADAPP